MPLSTLNWGEKNDGGVDSVCQMLVRQLAAKSRPYRYRVLAFDPFNNHSYTGEVVVLSEYVEVVICPLKESRYGLRLPSFISAWLRIQEQIRAFQPDIVHSHLSSWVLGLSRKRCNILTLHSYRKIGRKPVSMANDFVYEKVVPILSELSVDYFTCVGEQLNQVLLDDTKKPIQIIGNPVDPGYFVSAYNTSANASLNLVTCALLSRNKRIDRAICLLRELKLLGKKATLRIIGPNVDPVYYGELQQLVKDWELEEEVIFLGKLNQREIVQQYQLSDVGIFSSAQETFGLVPLEMLAAGLPLVSSPVGILGERQAEFAKLGVVFIQKGEEAKVAHRIEDIKATDMRAAQAYLIDQFAVESVIERYQGLYKAVLT